MLEKKDYEILEFLYKNPRTHIDKILIKFPEDDYATSFRLEALAVPEYKRSPFTGNQMYALSNTSYIVQEFEKDLDDKTLESKNIPTGIYSLNDLGKLTVQDYRTRNKHESRKTVLNSFIFPSLVAFLTTLLTLGIRWLLGWS